MECSITSTRDLSIKHGKRVSFDVYCPFIPTDSGIASAFRCLPIYSLLNFFPFILQVLGYLPLDWLSDCNHARCLTALFTCDILFTSAVLKVTAD